MSEVCITLLCPRGTEERVMDLLLNSPDTTVLASSPRSIHGLDPDELDATEQVLGGARATHIQAIVAESRKAAVFDLLYANVRGAGLHFWVTPVIEAGVIG